MKTYTGWQYLLIDAANNSPFGLDKKTFEERIAWATENLSGLENSVILGKQWKEKPLYLKAVQAIRKTQRGEPTGHLVGLDAVCSGMQIMAALTGCLAGATATGLIAPDHRADAYTDCTNLMADILGYHVPNEREKTKQALMTAFYGSKAEPKKMFGEDTPELAAFYQAMYILSPGACELLQALLDSWQAYALVHEWKLPDGYQARVKVMQKVEDCRIEVDELNHSTFTYQYYINRGEKKGVKNAANAVHSIDAYILRSLIRRCNYDAEVVELASTMICDELLSRELESRGPKLFAQTAKVAYYLEQYYRSTVVDTTIVEHLTGQDIQSLPGQYLRKLNTILLSMLKHKPFEVVTIHDQFSAHANNMNWVRMHYKDILADLAESNLLADVLSQLHGSSGGTYQKRTPALGAMIRNSNYALC